jgi:hypothetical protein
MHQLADRREFFPQPLRIDPFTQLHTVKESREGEALAAGRVEVAGQGLAGAEPLAADQVAQTSVPVFA